MVLTSVHCPAQTSLFKAVESVSCQLDVGMCDSYIGDIANTYSMQRARVSDDKNVIH